MTIRVAVPALAAILAVLAACAAPQKQHSLVATVLYHPCTDGTDFVTKKVRLLAKGGFNFLNNGASVPNGDDYVPPKPDPDQKPLGNYIAILAEAYSIAPDYLKQALCQNVDYLYIDQDSLIEAGTPTPLGWSYWEEKALGQFDSTKAQSTGPGSGYGVFISVNKEVLDDTTGSVATIGHLVAITLSEVHTTSTNKIVYVSDLATPNAPVQDIVAKDVRNSTSTSQDAKAEAVLAILAREMGFVTEHELTVQPAMLSLSGKPAIPTCKLNDAAGSTFYDVSWAGQYDSNKPQPYLNSIHTIGSPQGRPPNSNPPTADAINGELRQKAIVDMKKIYGTSNAASGKLEFASLLATQAPIEDFVETYSLLAMSNTIDPNSTQNSKSPLMTSFYLDFTNTTKSYDLISGLQSSNLSGPLMTKVDCLGDLNNGLIAQLLPLQTRAQ